MSGAWGAIAQAVGQIANTGMNQIATRDLAQLQKANQMQIDKNSQNLNKEMWDYTNYENQVNHMKNAGLNVGLMYKNGGDSGTTGNINSSAGMPNLPQSSLNIGEILQNQSNIKLQEAQINKLNAEAENLRGSDRDNTNANTKVQEEEAERKRIDNIVANATIGTNIDKAGAEFNILVANFRSKSIQNDIDAQTQNEKIEKIKLEVAGKILENELTEAKINLTDEQKRAISVELAQEWEALGIKADELGQRKYQNAIYEFAEKWQARLGLKNLEMRKIEAGLNTITRVLGRSNVKIDNSGERRTTIQNY